MDDNSGMLRPEKKLLGLAYLYLRPCALFFGGYNAIVPFHFLKGSSVITQQEPDRQIQG